VARLYASAVPAGRLDAVEIATVYCAATFGGRPVPPEKVRDLDDRVRRLRKLA
jgi:hypothetical protein